MIYVCSAWVEARIYTSQEIANSDGTRVSRSVILVARTLDGKKLWVEDLEDQVMVSANPVNWKWACKYRAKLFGIPFIKDMWPGMLVPETLFYNDDGRLCTWDDYMQDRGLFYDKLGRLRSLSNRIRPATEPTKRSKRKPTWRIFHDGRVQEGNLRRARPTKQVPLRLLSVATSDWRIVRLNSIGGIQ